MAWFLEYVGLFVLLATGTAAAVTLLNWLLRGRRHGVRLGVLLIAFFSAAYLLGPGGWDELLGASPDSRSSFLQVVATLWWIAAAFTLNAALRQWVWNGVLLRAGKPAVPKLLTDLAAGFLYLVAIMVVMHFVYEKPITGLAATSGVAAS